MVVCERDLTSTRPTQWRRIGYQREIPYTQQRKWPTLPRLEEASSASRPLAPVSIAGEFKVLADEWKNDTALFSDITEISMHPAYQTIIGMGEEAVPLIIEDLERTGAQWFWALACICRARPVKPENTGDIEKMTVDWIEYLKGRGLI